MLPNKREQGPQSLAQEKKDRLRGWKASRPNTLASANQVSQHQHGLATAALYLGDRYDLVTSKKEKKEASKIASKITHLALDALDSQKPVQTSRLMEWLTWITDEMGDEHDEPAPTHLEVKVLDFLTRIEAVVEDPNDFSNDPADLPIGWSGVDARINDERSGDVYNVTSGGSVKNSTGARIAGYVPDIDGPVLGTVHSTGGGNKLLADHRSRIEEHVGLELNRKSSRVKPEDA